ncbi:MAG: leucine-rich repeat protein [Muribaculaceae bacterium]|nr:leucine-rich repeat protein [Muribaculaceae bacterium]
MKKILLTMLGALLALPGIARDFKYTYEGQTLTYTVLDEEAKTCQTKEGKTDKWGNLQSAWNKVSGNLVIPATVSDGTNEYTVTEIGFAAFYKCRGLTSVIIPDSVKRIGKKAFCDCSGLTSITIPDLVTTIGDYAFSGCTGLTSLTIGNSVKTIGESAFEDCWDLTSVIIPNSVTSIGDDAFTNCVGLIKSAYPNNLSNPFNSGVAISYPTKNAIIEDGVIFSSDKSVIYFAPISLVGEYTIPASVKEIGERAFNLCSGLTSVTIPNSVESIGKYAFSGCSSLKEFAVEDGNSLIAFEDLALYSAPIEKLYIGRNWSNDYNRAISISIKSVEFGSGVTEIPNYAFCKCNGLTAITIPNSVTSIGDYAYFRCNGLKEFTVQDGDTPIVFGLDALDSPIEKLYMGRNWSFVYNEAMSTSIKSVEFGSSVTRIPIYAFKGCSGLTSVTIPKSVERIGASAFKDCSSLTEVNASNVIPPNIKDSSFDGIYATATLSVPEDAMTDYLATPWSLFENIKGGNRTVSEAYETGNLKYRLIPGATDADKNFAVVIPGDYSSLTEITIPERFTVTEGGKNKHYYVDAIGYKAFNKCTNLATVIFNSKSAIKAIGDSAFAESRIKAITLPATVESVGDYAFDRCGNLADVTLSESLRTIGNYAFNECTALPKIEIPGSVKSIGDYAFYHTSNLVELILNEGLETIGKYAFCQKYHINRLFEPLYMPSSLKSVGEMAFANFNPEYVNIADLASWCNIDFADWSANPLCGTSLYLNDVKIENLVIPDSVVEIKPYAFASVKGIEPITLNDGLKRIGEYAFCQCYAVSIVIPGSVIAIESGALSIWRLTDVTFAYGPEQIDVAAEAFATGDLNNISVDRPLEGMKFRPTKLKKLTIGNSVTEIPAAQFKDLSLLSSLTLGSKLKAIGDSAFASCTKLTEVILPPSVETIGASAFDGNNKLTSIIMGHNVKSVGEKAFNLSPAQTVSITAQIPPDAQDNTFSNYTGNLYVQGENTVKLYYDADFCWYQFEGHVMIEPTDFKVEGDNTLNGKPGDTFQLTAKLYPDNVTLPQVFWRSTNPDIATVDENGLVTLHAPLSDVMAKAESNDSDSDNSCKIIAESLYANGPVAEFTVNSGSTGIDDIVGDNDSDNGEIDFSAPVEVYNLQGAMVGDSLDGLAHGFYIVRQGRTVSKIMVH